eukprot:12928453-Prorocentrum_lima.AAC.1
MFIDPEEPENPLEIDDEHITAEDRDKEQQETAANMEVEARAATDDAVADATLVDADMTGGHE